MNKKSPKKGKHGFSIKLSDQHVKMICDIRALTDTYESPYGVNEEGQIGTFPDVMFVILLEQELFELKQRLGIPVFECPECNAKLKSIDDFAEKVGNGYIQDFIVRSYENMQQFAQTGDLEPNEEAKTEKET